MPFLINKTEMVLSSSEQNKWWLHFRNRKGTHPLGKACKISYNQNIICVITKQLRQRPQVSRWVAAFTV